MIDATETKTREKSPRPAVDASPQQSGETLAESARPAETRKFRSEEKEFFPQKTTSRHPICRIIGLVGCLIMAGLCLATRMHIEEKAPIDAYHKIWLGAFAAVFGILALFAAIHPRYQVNGSELMSGYWRMMLALIMGLYSFAFSWGGNEFAQMRVLESLWGVLWGALAASYWLKERAYIPPKLLIVLHTAPAFLVIVGVMYLFGVPNAKVLLKQDYEMFLNGQFFAMLFVGVIFDGQFLAVLVTGHVLDGIALRAIWNSGGSYENAPSTTSATAPENKAANGRTATANEKAALL